MTSVIGIDGICDRLPHRYPFLLVDRILETGPEHAVGLKNITINESYFQGHFPGRPIVPGVMIMEMMMQTSAFIGATPDEIKDAGNLRHFCLAVNVKFTQSVEPGDQLRLEARFVRRLGDMTKVSVRAFTDRGVAASGDLSLAVLTD